MIRNLREEEVSAFLEKFATDEVLRARGFEPGDALREDLACWILNRLSPRYSGSIRGANYHPGLPGSTTEAELIPLLFSGLDLFRRPPRPTDAGEAEGEAWLVAPLFTGRVRSAEGGKTPEGAQVHLTIDGRVPSFHLQPGSHPSPVLSVTGGAWSLWPDPEAGVEKAGSVEVTVAIEISHPDGRRSGHAEKVLLSEMRTRPGAPPAGRVHRFPDLYL